MDKTNQLLVNSGSSILARIRNEDWPPEILEFGLSKNNVKSKSTTSSLLVELFASAFANLFIAASEPSSRAIT